LKNTTPVAALIKTFAVAWCKPADARAVAMPEFFAPGRRRKESRGPRGLAQESSPCTCTACYCLLTKEHLPMKYPGPGERLSHPPEHECAIFHNATMKCSGGAGRHRSGMAISSSLSQTHRHPLLMEGLTRIDFWRLPAAAQRTAAIRCTLLVRSQSSNTKPEKIHSLKGAV